MSTLFLADPDKDNAVRAVSFASEEGAEVVFAISQNRSASKKEGQDAISAVLRGSWECCVLCDGHDVHGHLVARALCEKLAVEILDSLEGKQLDSLDAEDAIYAAFESCEQQVMWSNSSIVANCFVRVLHGEWAGQVGYVSEYHAADDSFSVIIIDENSYHRPKLSRDKIVGAKYIGGSTCVAFIRDSTANLVRIAVMGDTRALVLRSSSPVLRNDPIWEEISPGCFLTYPHDVYNTSELVRLNHDWKGEFEIQGPYMVNPLSGCEIQPTRGFGDFDMYGTGYIPIPDVSKPFSLEKGTIVMVGSDGLFDDQVWPDFKEVCKFVTERVDKEAELVDIAEQLHAESVRRGLLTDYVDDISFFICWAFPPDRGNAATTTSGGGGTAKAAPRSPTSGATNGGAVSHKRGLGSMVTFQEGVEGLADISPGTSFVSIGSLMPLYRNSATLSEVDQARRISTTSTSTQKQLLSSERARASTEVLPTGGNMSPPTLPGVRARTSSNNHHARPQSTNRSEISQRQHRRSERAQTESFLDPSGGPRQKSSYQAATNGFQKSHGDAVRHTRGPSFMIPDVFADETMPVAIDIPFPGDGQLSDSMPVATPADVVRAEITRRHTEMNLLAGKNKAMGGSSIQLGKQRSFGMPSTKVNPVLQRIASHFGHDINSLETLLEDLDVV